MLWSCHSSFPFPGFVLLISALKSSLVNKQTDRVKWRGGDEETICFLSNGNTHEEKRCRGECG